MRTAVLTSVIYLCIFLFIPVWVLQVDSGCSFQEGLGCCSPVADPVSGGFVQFVCSGAMDQVLFHSLFPALEQRTRLCTCAQSWSWLFLFSDLALWTSALWTLTIWNPSLIPSHSSTRCSKQVLYLQKPVSRSHTCDSDYWRYQVFFCEKPCEINLSKLPFAQESTFGSCSDKTQQWSADVHHLNGVFKLNICSINTSYISQDVFQQHLSLSNRTSFWSLTSRTSLTSDHLESGWCVMRCVASWIWSQFVNVTAGLQDLTLPKWSWERKRDNLASFFMKHRERLSMNVGFW